MIRALIKNPNTGQSRWFDFPLYFGALMKIGCSGNYNNMIEVVEIEGAVCFSPGFYRVEDLERLNQLVDGYD